MSNSSFNLNERRFEIRMLGWSDGASGKGRRHWDPSSPLAIPYADGYALGATARELAIRDAASATEHTLP